MFGENIPHAQLSSCLTGMPTCEEVPLDREQGLLTEEFSLFVFFHIYVVVEYIMDDFKATSDSLQMLLRYCVEFPLLWLCLGFGRQTGGSCGTADCWHAVFTPVGGELLSIVYVLSSCSEKDRRWIANAYTRTPPQQVRKVTFYESTLFMIIGVE